jgi:V/A-type H+-transporting ATPase subunit C
MSSSAAQFSYLHGRVSVLAERLLPAAAVDTLIAAGPDEELSLLALAGLAHLDTRIRADSTALEQALISSLIEDAGILSHALTGTARDLLIYWSRRHELGNLKAILRGKLTDQPVEAIRAQLVDIGQFATLPVEALLQTDDTAELLRRVEITPYGDIARQARRVYEEQQQLFALDAAVDRRYYVGLAKRVKSVGVGGGEQLRALIGVILDRMNLSWLLRYRFAYHLAPAETYYLLIPAGFRLSGTRLRDMAQQSSIEDVLGKTPPPLRDLLQGLSTTLEIDRALERETWRVADLTLHRTAFNLARAFAYLVLRERDLNMIHAILKGKHLSIPAAQIKSALGLAVASVDGRVTAADAA